MTQTPEYQIALNRALGLLSDTLVPEYVDTTWVMRVFGIGRSSVYRAIYDEKLPAEPVRNGSGTVVSYRIRPGDALLLWGRRLVTRGPDGGADGV